MNSPVSQIPFLVICLIPSLPCAAAQLDVYAPLPDGQYKSNRYEVRVEQGLDGARCLNASDGLDSGAGHGLVICDNGESFERCPGESSTSLEVVEILYLLREERLRGEHPAVAQASEFQTAILVFGLECVQRRCDFLFRAGKRFRQTFDSQRLLREKQQVFD